MRNNTRVTVSDRVEHVREVLETLLMLDKLINN